MPSVNPSEFVATRLALHRLAELVVSPVRQRATGGRIALEARPGGFGTHDLPDGGWAGVAGSVLIAVDAAGAQRRQPVTTLRAAAEFFGDPRADTLPDDPLQVDEACARQLADALASGTAALGELLQTAEAGDDPSGIDLWPEHFDVAITLGAEATGTRATFGVSPGDEGHDLPYAYVGPWTLPDGVAGTSGWNATGFTGAELPLTTADAALAFFQERRSALAALPS